MLNNNIKNDDFSTDENAYISDNKNIDIINNIIIDKIIIKKIINSKFKLSKM